VTKSQSRPILGKLLEELPLSPRWAIPELFEDTVSYRDLNIGLAGL
jgi:hypothetical protein